MNRISILFIIIIGFSSKNLNAQFCTPLYENTDASIYAIDSFSIGTLIDNKVNIETYGAPLYVDKSDSMTAILTAGDTIRFRMYHEFSTATGIYIDLNNDQSFDESTELMAFSFDDELSGFFVLPNTVIRNTNLRLRLRNVSDYGRMNTIAVCDSFDNGQTIDYSIYVLADGVPFTAFKANDTTIYTVQSVDFTDKSLNGPEQWIWNFEGGQPSTSNLQHPQNIRYTKPGCYTVSLTTVIGSETSVVTKTCYISSTSSTSFDATDTTITTIEYINFHGYAIEEPDFWKWKLNGAEIDTSSQQNPRDIIYREPGCYEVLLSTNFDGLPDSANKTCYIEVTQAPPGADFASSDSSILAGETISFYDSSDVVAKAWTWYIDSTISFSNEQNPEDILFNSEGVYEISLSIVDENSNMHYITKKKFITVENSESISEIKNINSLLIYPNPSTGQFNISFKSTNPEDIHLSIFSINGQEMYQEGIFSSTQRTSIKIEHLLSGVYFIQLKGKKDLITQRIIIQ